MTVEDLRIGEIAQQAGVSTRALRYYEEQGLLHPRRTPSGQRIFPVSAVERVQLIQQLFDAGLSSPLLAVLLPAIDERHLAPALSARLLVEHERLEAEVSALQAASRRLAALIKLVEHPDDATCPGSLNEAVNEDPSTSQKTTPTTRRRLGRAP
ncbi:MerR family transcriptional regulator [Serinibacter arcticus]|uniref:MerR family transcriptional regulator n=1 Tax=Serinibacter arcticus TaxID=1655435 RepID=UPI0010926EFA|nr:MerR family transcriptional regulator [Serinibacter arcticus]